MVEEKMEHTFPAIVIVFDADTNHGKDYDKILRDILQRDGVMAQTMKLLTLSGLHISVAVLGLDEVSETGISIKKMAGVEVSRVNNN